MKKLIIKKNLKISYIYTYKLKLNIYLKFILKFKFYKSSLIYYYFIKIYNRYIKKTFLKVL